MSNISKRLGVDSEGQPLTKALCMKKVKILRDGLKKEKYSGKLRGYAVYYANWYAWRAKNGKRTAVKAKPAKKASKKKAA